MGKVHVKKDDIVYVLGGKDGGKKGKVLSVDSGDRTVTVQGVNIVTKHVKAKQQRGFKKGGIIHQEAPIAADKVMLICGKCGIPTKVGRKLLEDGTKARVCRKCGEVIDVIGEKND